MAGGSVQEERAAVAQAVLLQQRLDVAGIVGDTVTIAVIAVDEDEEATGGEVYLGALVVTGGGAYPTLGVTIDGQSMDVDHAAADAFVGLSLTADAEGQGVAHELGGVEAANAVAIGDGGQVDEVDQRVNLVEGLALQDAAYQGLGGGAIAGGVFTAGFIDAAGSGDGGNLFQALGGERLAEVLLLPVYLIPEGLRVRGVHHVGLHTGSDKVWTDGGYLLRNNDVHWAAAIKVTLLRQHSVPSERTMRTLKTVNGRSATVDGRSATAGRASSCSR